MSFFGGLKDTLLGTSGAGPAIGLFNKLSRQQEQMLNKAAGFQQLGINSLMGGFDQARTGVKQASGVAKQQSRDIATSALGGTQSSAISRGLFNTSTFDAANRGIGSDLMRHLASIDAMTSQQLGGIDQAQAGSMAAGYGQMGSLYTQFANQQNQLGQSLMGVVGQGSQGILGPLLNAGAMAIGASDPRLKQNIELVGEHSGIPVYHYDYIDGSGRYEGVMAPDVEHLGVVSRDERGYQMVNYTRLKDLIGFEFKKLGGAVSFN